MRHTYTKNNVPFNWNSNLIERLLFYLAILFKTKKEILTHPLHKAFPLCPHSGFPSDVSTPPSGLWRSFYTVPVSDFSLYSRPYPLPSLCTQRALPVWTESQYLNIQWVYHPHNGNFTFCHTFSQAAYENLVLFWEYWAHFPSDHAPKTLRTVNLHGQLEDIQTRTLFHFLLHIRGLNSPPTVWHTCLAAIFSSVLTCWTPDSDFCIFILRYASFEAISIGQWG